MSRLARAAGRLRATPGEVRHAGSLRVWLLYPPGPGPWLMSWVRRRWVLWRNPHARIEFRGPVYLGPGFSLDMPWGGTFIAGPGTQFRRNFRAELGRPDARIVIGAGTVFTYEVVIQCSSSIEIGEQCVFAQGALVVDGSHRFRDAPAPIHAQGYDLRPVALADHVSVMAKATVIADVGEHTMVGANSVVTRPAPSYCLVAGVPARAIDYFGPPGAEPPELALRSANAETDG